MNSIEECSTLCRDIHDCQWFSFDGLASSCFLFRDCPTMDHSCKTCASSNTQCKGKTGETFNCLLILEKLFDCFKKKKNILKSYTRLTKRFQCNEKNCEFTFFKRNIHFNFNFNQSLLS